MIELIKELADFALMFSVGWLTFEIYAIAQAARGDRKTERMIEEKYGKTY
jgi:hypothetical protein